MAFFSMASGANEEAAALAASLAGLKDSGEPTIFDKVRPQCTIPSEPSEPEL